MSGEQHPLARLAERGEARGADELLRSARSAAGHPRSSTPVWLAAAACALVIAAVGTMLLVNDDGGTSEVRTADPVPDTAAPTDPDAPTVPPTAPSESTPGDEVIGCEAPELGPQRDGVDFAVEVFLYCGDGVAPVELFSVQRVVPAEGEPLRTAMTQLLLGVTPAERAGGLSSAFSPYTAGTLRGVRVDSGVATLDLTFGFATTNNFSTSNVSAVVLDQIQATVFQFPEIDAIEFEIEGERWCWWENTCDGAPEPFITRD